jgi:hypothetical protein
VRLVGEQDKERSEGDRGLQVEDAEILKNATDERIRHTDLRFEE